MQKICCTSDDDRPLRQAFVRTKNRLEAFLFRETLSFLFTRFHNKSLPELGRPAFTLIVHCKASIFDCSAKNEMFQTICSWIGEKI